MTNGRRSGSKRTPQSQMDETKLEATEELISDLQEWESRNNSRKDLARQARDIKKKIDSQIEDLPEGVHRADEFTITVALSKSKNVSFTTEGGKRSTKIVKDKGEE